MDLILREGILDLKNISLTDKAVLSVMIAFNQANGEKSKKIVKVKPDKIAGIIQVDPKTVSRSISKLIEKCFIHKIRANEYQLLKTEFKSAIFKNVAKEQQKEKREKFSFKKFFRIKGQTVQNEGQVVPNDRQTVQNKGQVVPIYYKPLISTSLNKPSKPYRDKLKISAGESGELVKGLVFKILDNMPDIPDPVKKNVLFSTLSYVKELKPGSRINDLEALLVSRKIPEALEKLALEQKIKEKNNSETRKFYVASGVWSHIYDKAEEKHGEDKLKRISCDFELTMSDDMRIYQDKNLVTEHFLNKIKQFAGVEYVNA